MLTLASISSGNVAGILRLLAIRTGGLAETISSAFVWASAALVIALLGTLVFWYRPGARRLT